MAVAVSSRDPDCLPAGLRRIGVVGPEEGAAAALRPECLPVSDRLYGYLGIAIVCVIVGGASIVAILNL